MTPEQFKNECIGTFEVDGRSERLYERIELYYKQTPTVMSNRQALPYWIALSKWWKENGYTFEEFQGMKTRVLCKSKYAA